MQNIKVENFNRAHPNVAFPVFKAIQESGCAELRRQIATRLGLAADAPPLDLVTSLVARDGHTLGEAPDAGPFDIGSALRAVGLEACTRVYLNWYRFDDIDEMQLDDLSKYFDDIWYPSTDDLDVFDSTFSWVLSVTHDGRIIVRRLPPLAR
jgi:hypothetical protein